MNNAINNVMNVAIYARFSSHNQTEQSIEGQLKVCKEYAQRNSMNIIKIYKDEAKSGTSDNRPQFKQMIEDSKNKTFQGVLVYQLDRFARNRYDSATYKAKLKKNGVRVFSARENISDDASGILMESVLEGMAEYYSAELGQKVVRGMDINAENFFYNGGTVPLGLKLKDVPVPIGVNGKMVIKKQYDIDEEKAQIIKKIFEMYIQDYTMADIIKYLNDRNIKTAYGKEFNKNSIRTIILNKKYVGIYSYKGKDTHNIIPQIIDDDTFYKAQEKLLKNKEAPARARAKTEYLLTTKLYCGECKEMMIGVSGTSKTGKLHTYYGCKGNIKHKCKKRNLHKNQVEDIVINKARELLTDENINEIANAVYKTACKKQDSTRLKSLQREILNLEKERENLFSSLKVCDIDNVRKSIFEEISKMEEQKLKVQTQISLEESSIFKVEEKDIKTFLKSLRNGDYNTTKYRKMIINILINKVYWYDKNLIIIFNIQNKNGDLVRAKIPTINEIENSFTLNSNCPLKTDESSFKGSMAGVEGFEPSHLVLETSMLPLTSYPYVKNNSFLLYSFYLKFATYFTKKISKTLENVEKQ